MSNEDPSLAIRPTRGEIRRNQLKDLKKPGWVVILHTGEVLTEAPGTVKPSTEGERDSKCPK